MVSVRRCHGKQITLLKGTTKERTNEVVYVGWRKILYNCLINKNKIALKFVTFYIKFPSEVLKLTLNYVHNRIYLSVDC